MTISLRRRHYYTWLLLAVLLPLGVWWAYTHLPQTPTSDFSRQVALPYPTLLKTQQTDQLKVALRADSAQNQQLELVILKPLIGAANQVYVSNSAQNPRQILMGSVANTGLYRFALPQSVAHSSVLIVSIYDVFKQKEIEKVTIK